MTRVWPSGRIQIPPRLLLRTGSAQSPAGGARCDVGGSWGICLYSIPREGLAPINAGDLGRLDVARDRELRRDLGEISLQADHQQHIVGSKHKRI